jgi:hypothetical protein
MHFGSKVLMLRNRKSGETGRKMKSKLKRLGGGMEDCGELAIQVLLVAENNLPPHLCDQNTPSAKKIEGSARSV